MFFQLVLFFFFSLLMFVRSRFSPPLYCHMNVIQFQTSLDSGKLCEEETEGMGRW